ncbi:hypothetical protein LIER_14739 [Lithospermum erythrorhizon]|uniref:Retrotransposon gag domain-containing protein n=1 Tax=Lithospermum erythrorhizon TaxID=34254 RepID=A0AAV3Q264_LITER
MLDGPAVDGGVPVHSVDDVTNQPSNSAASGSSVPELVRLIIIRLKESIFPIQQQICLDNMNQMQVHRLLTISMCLVRQNLKPYFKSDSSRKEQHESKSVVHRSTPGRATRPSTLTDMKSHRSAPLHYRMSPPTRPRSISDDDQDAFYGTLGPVSLFLAVSSFPNSTYSTELGSAKTLKGIHSTHMTITSNNPDVYAKAFPNSLTDKALDWYMELPLKSIDTYQAMADFFIAKFGTAIQTMQDEHILMDIKQGANESLSSYYNQHNDLLLNILVVDASSHTWRFSMGWPTDKNLLPKPARMRGAPGKREKNWYCEYHREYGDDTNECRILKAEIAKLIELGYLKEFIGQERGRSQGRGFSPP